MSAFFRTIRNVEGLRAIKVSPGPKLIQMKFVNPTLEELATPPEGTFPRVANEAMKEMTRVGGPSQMEDAAAVTGGGTAIVAATGSTTVVLLPFIVNPALLFPQFF